MALGSLVEGVPRCMLKHVKAREILSDTEGLKKISKRMRKGQLKAMLQGVSKEREEQEIEVNIQCLHSILQHPKAPATYALEFCVLLLT